MEHKVGQVEGQQKVEQVEGLGTILVARSAVVGAQLEMPAADAGQLDTTLLFLSHYPCFFFLCLSPFLSYSLSHALFHFSSIDD